MTAALNTPAPYPDFDGTQNCYGGDDETWFPPKGSHSWTRTRQRAVANLCGNCPFQRPCLAYALTNDVQGVWANTSHQERRQIRRQHNISAAPVEAGGGASMTRSLPCPELDDPQPRSPSPPASPHAPSPGSAPATGSSHDH